MNIELRRDFLKKLGLLGAASFSPFRSSPVSAQPRAEDPPNIVLLLSDDQSRPDLGCYGNPAVRTPALDQLASEGMRFNRAYVTSSSCSPSRGSLFTGRSPHATGSSKLHVWVLPEIDNLLSLLKAQGYHFGAYRKLHQDNYSEGFDFYGDEDAPLDAFFDERPEDRPFFLWFGSNEPHRPYSAGFFDPPHDPDEVVVPDFLPDTALVREDLTYYYDQLSKFDADCGTILELLEANDLAENTMVVATSDNGMAFPRAKATCYEAGLNVPLLIRWPAHVEAGGVSDELVSFVDLTATWLEMAGTTLPGHIEGRSLLPLLSGEDYQPHEYIFAGRNWHDNWLPARAVIGERFKLIQNYRLDAGYIPSLDIQQSRSYESILELQNGDGLDAPLSWYANTSRPQQELYDLQNDPGEWQNLADDPDYESELDALETALSEWIDATHDFLPPPKHAYGAFNEAYEDVNPLDGWLEEGYRPLRGD